MVHGARGAWSTGSRSEGVQRSTWTGVTWSQEQQERASPCICSAAPCVSAAAHLKVLCIVPPTNCRQQLQQGMQQPWLRSWAAHHHSIQGTAACVAQSTLSLSYKWSRGCTCRGTGTGSAGRRHARGGLCPLGHSAANAAPGCTHSTALKSTCCQPLAPAAAQQQQEGLLVQPHCALQPHCSRTAAGSSKQQHSRGKGPTGYPCWP